MSVQIVQHLSTEGLAHHLDLNRVHPQDLVPLQELLEPPGRDNKQEVVFRAGGAHGTWQWFELHAQVFDRAAVKDGSQGIGVLTDITERKRLAEHAALQQRFLEVLAQSPDRPTLVTTILDAVLGLSDLDGGGLYWQRGDGGFDLVASRGLSDTFLDRTGNIAPQDPRAAIIHAGTMVCSCVDPQDACTDPGVVHHAYIQDEGIVALVVLPITVGGRGHACLNLASKHVKRLPASSIALLERLAGQFGLAIERLMAREDAQNQRKNLEGFFRELQDFVFVLNPKGEMLYVNPAVYAKLGYDEKLLGQSVLAVHPERVHASAWTIVSEMLEGKRESCPLPLLRADGIEVMVDTRIVHGTWNGEPALLGVSRDISEQRALEQALSQKNEERRVELERFQAMAAHVPGVIFQFRMRADGTTHVPYASQGIKDIYGVKPEEVCDDAKAVFDAVHPDDLPAMLQSIAVSAAGLTPWVDEHRVRLPDGSTQWVRGHANPLRQSDGSTLWHGYIRNSSAERKAREQLLMGASVFANSYEGILIADANNMIVDVNPAFTRITGFEREEVLGKTPRILSSGRQGPDFYARLWKSLSQHDHWSGEVWNRRKSGEVFAEILSISAVRDDVGKLLHYLAVFSDITRLKAHESELAHIANYDVLTGVPNRRLLSDRLKVALAHARRAGTALAVCMLDLDGFKDVNDRLGHASGDLLLIEVSRRLQAVLRENDTLARLGGDEFVLLFSDLHQPDETHRALSRVLQTIGQPMRLGDAEALVSASIGVTLFPLEDADADTLLRHADQAMYAAKQAGKNRYHLFDSEHDRLIKDHQEQLERLEQALAQGELVLYYQPKVNLATGQIIGAEALIRWQHPEHGLLAPATFLPLISGTQLEIAVGQWVLDNVLQQIARWNALGLDGVVSANISADHLLADGFVDQLQSILQQYPQVPPHQLELEILETAAIGGMERASKVLRQCRALGVRFALDDFGTGYSSLSYFRSLAVDMIKIDQSFVRDLLEDPNDLGIVDSVVRLAQAFNRPVIAEGVETLEHGDVLLRLGCQLAQGYGVSRPMPAAQYAQWTNEWTRAAPWKNRSPLTASIADLPLLAATRSHRVWMDTLIAHLDAGDTTVLASIDSGTCGFGQWYQGGGSARFGHLPSFHAIGRLHDHVHALAHEVFAVPWTMAPASHGGQRLALLQASRQLSLALDALVQEVRASQPQPADLPQAPLPHPMP